MIKLGIFAKTFTRNHLNEVLDAVVDHGFSTIQFNMACVGLASMPDHIPSNLAREIGTACQKRRLTMAAVSGTFNMIHPDREHVRKGLQRLEVLAQHCRAMGTDTITLCTGTRDARDQWRAHPDNNLPDAWIDLLSSMEKALQIAERHNILLAFEPETANVINSTAKGKKLLQELQSKHLKVVFDPANLFEKASVEEIKRLITQGLDDLEGAIIMAHAKDRTAEGTFTAAGKGIIPFDFFVAELERRGFEGALVTHGLAEAEVPAVAKTLKALV